MRTTSNPVIPDDISELPMSREEGQQLYDSLAPWFEAQGYSLYPRDLDNPTSKLLPGNLGAEMTSEIGNPPRFPYAHVVGRGPTRRAFEVLCTIFPAVNREDQDVVIKLIYNEGFELEICQHLMTEAARRDKLNMTIPILDTLPFSENWSFIVMPRWGSTSGLQRWGFNDIRTAFHYMSSVLKSLVFLHQNLIVHRDIRPDNILINCITNRVVTDLRPFLDSGHAKFALCDFGLSFKFPPDTPLEERLRPSIDCCIGTLEYQPPDGTDGEAFYDPFAFDVACLGGVFCELVGHLTTLVNPLAPFLDRMVTHDISARYTAEEALRALTQLEAQLSPECLTTRVMRPPVGPLAKEYCPWQAYNRWSDLPLSFIAQHPAPPSSMKSKSYDDDWKPYFDVYTLEASFLKLFAA